MSIIYKSSAIRKGADGEDFYLHDFKDHYCFSAMGRSLNVSPYQMESLVDFICEVKEGGLDSLSRTCSEAPFQASKNQSGWLFSTLEFQRIKGYNTFYLSWSFYGTALGSKGISVSLDLDDEAASWIVSHFVQTKALAPTKEF
jgi:hypothetical protein